MPRLVYWFLFLNILVVNNVVVPPVVWVVTVGAILFHLVIIDKYIKYKKDEDEYERQYLQYS